MHCGSFIARTVSKIIRKTGNPPHRNGINRHHAAEKPQDVPPICIPGRHPLSLQASIGLSPLFRKKRKPSPRPEVLRFADPIRNGLPSPVSSGGTLSTPVRIRSSPRFQPLSHFFIMAKLERLVIHCTATPPGREVSAADIRRWHTAPVSQGGRGWRQVGYTDLIHLDGSVERLVPNNEDRTVDPWEITNGACGYNATSRHIAYAGGVAADGTTPCDTRTPQQKSALEHYVRDFVARFPGAAVVGHNELAAKACPSFDVQAWLRETGIL